MKITAVDPVIEEFANKLHNIPEVRKIILYGSRARGDFEDWSDYDVMILVSIKDKYIEARIDKIAWGMNYKKSVSIIPVVCTESSFRKEKYEPLFMNIKREGIVL